VSCTKVRARTSFVASYGVLSSSLRSSSILTSPNIDVCGPGAHGIACDEATLDQLVGILAHNFAVLARSRLRLVCVNYKEGGAAVTLLGHETPLQTTGETGTAPTPEPAVLDLLHDLVGAHPKHLLGVAPITALHGIR